MKVFLDTNVILDFFQQRIPWNEDATAIWVANEQGLHETFVSAVTLTTIFYVLRKSEGVADAWRAVDELLAAIQFAPVNDTIVRAARASGMADFEDAVQHASAVAANADVIVTRDPAGFALATLPVLSPADFRTQYLPQTDASSER